MKIMLVQHSMDGIISAKIGRVGDTIVFYNNGYNASKMLEDISKMFNNDEKVTAIDVVNVRLSNQDVVTLNRLHNKGMSVTYYGYVWEPSGLDGKVIFANNVSCSELIVNHLNIITNERIDKLIHWSRVAMFHDGDDASIEYAVEVNSLVRDITNGLDSIWYNKLLDHILNNIYEHLLLQQPMSYVDMFYNGRMKIRPILLQILNLDDSLILPYREIISIIVDKLGSEVYSVNNLKYRIFINAPHFNTLAKRNLSHLDFVINVSSKGYISIRSRVDDANMIANMIDETKNNNINPSKVSSLLGIKPIIGNGKGIKQREEAINGFRKLMVKE